MNRILSRVVLCSVVVLFGSLAFAGSGPEGFPLPSGAVKVTEESNEDGSLRFVTYNVPGKNWQKCSEEVRGLLKKEGWATLSEEISPRHSQVRLSVNKAKNTIQVQVSQEGDASQLFLDLGY